MSKQQFREERKNYNKATRGNAYFFGTADFIYVWCFVHCNGGALVFRPGNLWHEGVVAEIMCKCYSHLSTPLASDPKTKEAART